MNCLFCNIVKGTITPEAPLHEDATTLAFLDIHPHAPGHTVVIPKTHSENLLDVTPGDMSALFETVNTVTGKIQKALHPDGYTIGWNHGEKAGQAIGHLHIHILPRFENDGGGSIHSVVNNPPKTSIQALGALINNA